MKKILLFTAIVAMTITQSFGQLSTRENSDFNVRMGTRPQAGDGVLQFVLPMFNENGAAHLFRGNSLFANDFLTYKYYLKDDVALRAGLRWSVSSGKVSGTAADSSAINNIPNTALSELNQRYINRDFSIAAGLEKHFSNSNIFDVYAGGEILLGTAKDKRVEEYDSFDGDLSHTTSKRSSSVFGFGLVTGFNVFIAELPISVGVEYGLTGKWLFGDKTHVTVENRVGGTSVSGEYYSQSDDAFGNWDGGRQYSDLSRREFNMNTNHNVRLSVNIYFSTLANPRNSQESN